jgi:hypothetical protein
MSKIAPVQAAALKPTVKVATKAVAKKPAVRKPVATKPVSKAIVSKQPVKINPAKKPPLKKPAVKAAPAKKQADKTKPQKVKMERDSFTMPKDEYAQLTLLKARLNALGQPAKKSELLRAGIKLLVAMSDNTLKMTMSKIPVIKTGRPKKK